LAVVQVSSVVPPGLTEVGFAEKLTVGTLGVGVGVDVVTVTEALCWTVPPEPVHDRE
jgi:hypothetical protein